VPSIPFHCPACSTRHVCDQAVSGSIPACSSCGGTLQLAAPVVFTCLACGVRSKPTKADPTQARPCPRCRKPFSLAAVEAMAQTVQTTAEPKAEALFEETRSGNGLQPGDHFGRYVIERELARGGMGIVYIADEPALKRKVALKVLIAGDGAGTESVRRFVREARSAGQLRHPNIIAVHDAGEVDGRHYFTMDLVDGRELGRLPEEGASLRDLVALMRTVCLALEHAHAHGVVHRDLKPANIMVERDGRPLLMDFGLAKDVSGQASFNSLSGMVAGTPAYMSPEQAKGLTAEVDQRTDVYACGIILYELATGRCPFGGDTLFDTIRAVVSDEPQPPAKLSVEVDAALDAVILRCLEKDKDARYPSAVALADDLGRWLEGQPVLARRVPGVIRHWRQLRSRPHLLAGASIAAVVLLALVGVGLAFAMRDDWLDRASAELGSGDPERSQAAVVVMAGQLAGGVSGQDRQRGLELLRHVAAADHPGSADAAGDALARLADPPAATILLKRATDTALTIERRRRAIAALDVLGPAAEEADAVARALVVAAAQAPADLAQACCLTALHIASVEAIDPVSAMAANASLPSTLRVAALRALGEGKPVMHGAAMQRVLRCAGDMDAQVGAAAEAVLDKLRDREAVFTAFGLAGRAGDAMVATGRANKAVAERQRELLAMAGEDEDGNPIASTFATDPAATVAVGLRDPDPAKRISAVWDLGRVGGPGSVAPLSAAVADADGEVRRLAGRALVGVAAAGTPVSWQPLAELLASPISGVRSSAALALAGLEAREAVPRLVDVLPGEGDAVVRLALIEALGRCHDPAGLPALRQVLMTAQGDEAESCVRALAAGQAHAGAALPDLVAALRHSSRSVREAAAACLRTATGVDRGDDAQRWQLWLEQQPRK
jgi:hypothetical protein